MENKLVFICTNDMHCAVMGDESHLGLDGISGFFDADLALIPRWVLRDDLLRGAVSTEDIIRIHPLGHRVCSVRATGVQLLAALEQSVSRQPTAYRYWLQVSNGARVRFDQESHSLVAVAIDGASLKPGAEYVLAGLDFMVAGVGSSFAMFAGCEVLGESAALVGVIADYLRILDPGDIAACYGNVVGGAGRIAASRT